MAKEPVEPIRTHLLSTKDVRTRVELLANRIVSISANRLNNLEGFAGTEAEVRMFHTGKIAAAKTFLMLLTMTPAEYDTQIEALASDLADTKALGGD